MQFIGPGSKEEMIADAIPASFSRSPFRNTRAVVTRILHCVTKKETLPSGRTSRFAVRANRSAQNQEVKPVASGFRVGCVLGMSYGTTEAFFTAEELVLSEIAHRGVGVVESVHLAEEVREAG